MNTHRIFVEKKEAYKSEAKSLLADLNGMLGLNLHDVRIVNVYDLFNVSESDIQVAEENVLSEVVADDVLKTLDLSGKVYFATEFLPGQYDQRADWAQQALLLLTGNEEAVVKSGKVIILEGANEGDLAKVKQFVINPIEAREKDLTAELALPVLEVPEAVAVQIGFNKLSETGLEAFLSEQGMAMTLADLTHVQTYFRDEEKRDPFETELKVLDTYWSDHCRHTTFETILTDVHFQEGNFQATMQAAFEEYVAMREFAHGERLNQKPMTLMDMATIAGRAQRQLGMLDDLEVSDEINACSVYIDVEVDGKPEPYLLMFKNETHNHPTEIEPFGGASTCIGGAIRDPLSGRAYVYQAMRLSGGADITEKIEDTMPGKLPQVTISKGSAHGNSSYGNQIGLATTFVREIYHPGYKAKHMEVGAVVAAAPAKNVVRQQPVAGDVIILLGGATGRDGVGGATGSSKSHDVSSIQTASAEVQKGNAPVERKIQRLFRKVEVTTRIKKCNDFGAGGVAVAIGELADGLHIDLDKVPLKYAGLNGTEIAISESQERMAVVVDQEDAQAFIDFARAENLEAVIVATVTDDHRLTMTHQGVNIVSLSRDFLNTNGVQGQINVEVSTTVGEDVFSGNVVGTDLKAQFLNNLASHNVASQQGMVEMFDSNVGAGTVLMPYGGKYQLTETEGSVHQIPVLNGTTDLASLLTYGYNAEIAEKSPFHGAIYAVIESIAKVVALGGKWQGIRFSFQEYFQKLGLDPQTWGQPFAALLGAIHVQKGFGLPAIGGKDSMSGTYEALHVPPTLISFAVQTEKISNIISPEFKKADSYIYLFKHHQCANMMPNFDQLKANYDAIYEHISKGLITAAFTVKQGGIAEGIAKMTFGNKIGAIINTEENLFDKLIGSIIVESTEILNIEGACHLGITTTDSTIKINDATIEIEEAIAAWESTFKAIYPKATNPDKRAVEPITYERVMIKTSGLRVKPRVLVSAFPGTNSEYDSATAFQLAGAKTHIHVFRNLSIADINASIDQLSTEIEKSQILFLPGGFSAGDEPDGSAKFIAAVLKNEKVKASIESLLERNGLIIGICNGFQALIKSGLLPYQDFKVTPDSPTLAHNNMSRHQSKVVRTRYTGANSPWLTQMCAGDIHHVAISHGEGKFTAADQTIKQLIRDGLIAFQYVDLDGTPTMDEHYNPNGSTMAIEGLISPDGKVLGKMGHTERSRQGILKNVIGNYDQKIFKSGVEYFTK
ncbi:MAG: phosphoribosylformylglycinamidine synthase [Defluviitaleaceae bacterium]|nr:phosphoribosylformylglycinamidine synthase [Defluviitaleaceae bacterium]